MRPVLIVLVFLVTAWRAPAQAPSPAPTERLGALQRLVGGQWAVHGRWSDGRPLRARNVFEWGVNRAMIRTRTFVDGDQGEYQRYEDIFGWDAGRGCLVQTGFSFDGSFRQNRIDSPDSDTLRFGFERLNAADPEPPIRQVIHFTGPDAYTWTVTLKKDDGSWDRIIEATWQREPLPVWPVDPALFPASGANLRSLTKEATVPAPPREVFAAWTTPEGIRGFLGVEARVALRIGGPMELLFGKDTFPPGQQGSEGCQILAYVPDRMLAFSWNAPPKFPEERAQRAWVVVEFEPAGQGTRVRLTHTGFGAGGHWDDVYAYFDKAWSNVLAALTEHFTGR